jgi:hypothetical protein
MVVAIARMLPRCPCDEIYDAVVLTLGGRGVSSVKIDQPHTGIGKPRRDPGTFVCQPLYLACQVISARSIGALISDTQQYITAGKRCPDFQ